MIQKHKPGRLAARLVWDYDYYGDSNDKPFTVIEEDAEPQPSGLLDAEGRMLYRTPEKVRMGFHKD